MKKNTLFYLGIGVLFSFLLYFNSYFFKGSKKYLGVTSAKEYKISSEKAVTVKKVHVVPGKAVKKGELLVELTSKELEVGIDKLKNRIELLASEMKEKKSEVLSEVAYLRAQKGIKVEEIESDILKIKKETELNFKLLDQLRETNSGQTLTEDDPLHLELSSLNEKKRLHRKAVDIKIEEIRQKNSSQQNLITNRLKLLEVELGILQKEQEGLNKYATFDGVIENVFVKENEEVRSYSYIVSVNPMRPTSVVGYVVGQKKIPKKVGEKVMVSSFEKRTETFEGEIIGLGAITALPNILQKSTSVTAYGLEVFISIDADNRLSTGQKVVIN